VVGLRAHPTKILTPTSFVADNLTSSTTGVPSGTSLSTLGATTYTSANNGQSITAKQFTARVTLNGVTGMTFTNCLFQCATDYYCCILDSSCSGNTFNYCSFDGANGTFDTGRFPFKGTGATLFRCYSTGADNGGRFDSDCTMQECLVENLIHITDGSGNGVRAGEQHQLHRFEARSRERIGDVGCRRGDDGCDQRDDRFRFDRWDQLDPPLPCVGWAIAVVLPSNREFHGARVDGA
jgi:hypothetical protein